MVSVLTHLQALGSFVCTQAFIKLVQVFKLAAKIEVSNSQQRYFVLEKLLPPLKKVTLQWSCLAIYSTITLQFLFQLKDSLF